MSTKGIDKLFNLCYTENSKGRRDNMGDYLILMHRKRCANCRLKMPTYYLGLCIHCAEAILSLIGEEKP